MKKKNRLKNAVVFVRPKAGHYDFKTGCDLFIYFRDRGIGAVGSQAVGLEIEPVRDGTERKPLASLSRSQAQELVDRMIDYGIQPSRYVYVGRVLNIKRELRALKTKIDRLLDE